MTNITSTLPSLVDGGLSQYIESVKKFPMLSHNEEIELANRWVENEDVKAAEKLVTSHLRLVVKIAMNFRGYGLPMMDVISEGSIGLMQAVKRFDPKKGFRLSTYAMWWIKAAINEYVLRSWSLVKMGTTAGHKKLFYNLKKMKSRILGVENRNLISSEIAEIASDLGVSTRDVVEMDERLHAHDSSLNMQISDDNGSAQWEDYLADERDNQEVILAETQENSHQHEILMDAMSQLNEREYDIVKKRRMKDPASTLEELSAMHKVSKERIRQIENRAIEKMQAFVAG